MAYVSHQPLSYTNITDRDAVWGLIRVGPRNYYFVGIKITASRDRFEFSGQLKSIGSLCCGNMQQKGSLNLQSRQDSVEATFNMVDCCFDNDVSTLLLV